MNSRSDQANDRRPDSPGGPALSAIIGDSNDWTVRSLASLLAERGFQITRTFTPGQLVEKARMLQPDLVVVGARLGDLSGADACRVLRGMNSLSPATPLIVVTSDMVTEEERVENLRAGVWDTIRLPANAEELLLRIRRYVDAKLATDQARQERLVDAASGFYNLRGLLRRAEEEASEAWRARKPIACVVFGPDSETLDLLSGAGSEARTGELAGRLSSVFKSLGRRSDVIARKNAASFIVVGNSTDSLGARRLAQRLLGGMQSLEVPAGEGLPPHAVQMFAGYHVPEIPAQGSPDPVDWVARASGALMAAAQDASRQPITGWRTGDPRDELDFGAQPLVAKT